MQYFIITGQTSFKVGGHKLTPTLHPPPPKEKDPHLAAPPACPVIQGVLLRNSGWYEVNLLYMVMMVLNQSLWSLTSMWNPSLLPTTAFESITSFFTPFPLQIKRGCWYVGRIRNACLTHHYTNFPLSKCTSFHFNTEAIFTYAFFVLTFGWSCSLLPLFWCMWACKYRRHVLSFQGPSISILMYCAHELFKPYVRRSLYDFQSDLLLDCKVQFHMAQNVFTFSPKETFIIIEIVQLLNFLGEWLLLSPICICAPKGK